MRIDATELVILPTSLSPATIVSPDLAGVLPSSSKSAEFPVYMAARADALDDFLAEITALGETYGVIQGHFKEQILFIEIDAVPRNAGFDAQDILRLRADP